MKVAGIKLGINLQNLKRKIFLFKIVKYFWL